MDEPGAQLCLSYTPLGATATAHYTLEHAQTCMQLHTPILCTRALYVGDLREPGALGTLEPGHITPAGRTGPHVISDLRSCTHACAPQEDLDADDVRKPGAHAILGLDIYNNILLYYYIHIYIYID